MLYRIKKRYNNLNKEKIMQRIKSTITLNQNSSNVYLELYY